MALNSHIDVTTGLTAVMAKVGVSAPVTNPRRLSGGANLESWLFDCGEQSFVLRRAPSEEWLANRPIDMT